MEFGPDWASASLVPKAYSKSAASPSASGVGFGISSEVQGVIDPGASLLEPTQPPGQWIAETQFRTEQDQAVSVLSFRGPSGSASVGEAEPGLAVGPGECDGFSPASFSRP